MRAFSYETAFNPDDIKPNAGVIAGGTTLIDLMKLEVMTPNVLVDINQLPLSGIEFGTDALRIGALEKMSTVAEHRAVVTNYPVISQALLQSASPQLRNMATIGGNLLQRTRCTYFRDVTMRCNKRQPGSGCSAIEGQNRMHAIFGTSPSCVATHASDLAVALVALDATLLLKKGGSTRMIKLNDFYLLPGDTPEKETQLEPGELITEIRVPRLSWARKSIYVKVRDRQSYEFALTSAAVALNLEGNHIQDARITVGGVGTKPWNLPNVREELMGKEPNRTTFEEAVKRAVETAHSLKHNAFKIELMQRTIVRALMNLGGFT